MLYINKIFYPNMMTLMIILMQRLLLKCLSEHFTLNLWHAKRKYGLRDLILDGRSMWLSECEQVTWILFWTFASTKITHLHMRVEILIKVKYLWSMCYPNILMLVCQRNSLQHIHQGIRKNSLHRQNRFARRLRLRCARLYHITHALIFMVFATSRPILECVPFIRVMLFRCLERLPLSLAYDRLMMRMSRETCTPTPIRTAYDVYGPERLL